MGIFLRFISGGRAVLWPERRSHHPELAVEVSVDDRFVDIVKQGFDSLGEMDESEEDLLDRAWGLEPQSRLSCQAVVGATPLVVQAYWAAGGSSWFGDARRAA